MENTNKNTEMSQSCKNAVMQAVLLPTELRIGNLTSAGIVTEIQKDCFYVHDGKSSLKNTWFDIQSIPLTEEWLFKFRFLQSMMLTNFWSECELFNIFIDSEGIHYAIPLDHDGNFWNIKKIDYVHQLQNLYFSLTQTELTVA